MYVINVSDAISGLHLHAGGVADFSYMTVTDTAASPAPASIPSYPFTHAHTTSSLFGADPPYMVGASSLRLIGGEANVMKAAFWNVLGAKNTFNFTAELLIDSIDGCAEAISFHWQETQPISQYGSDTSSEGGYKATLQLRSKRALLAFRDNLLTKTAIGSLAGAALCSSPSVWRIVTVVFIRGTTSVYIDGELYLEFSDPNYISISNRQTSTYFGISARSSETSVQVMLRNVKLGNYDPCK